MPVRSRSNKRQSIDLAYNIVLVQDVIPALELNQWREVKASLLRLLGGGEALPEYAVARRFDSLGTYAQHAVLASVLENSGIAPRQAEWIHFDNPLNVAIDDADVLIARKLYYKWQSLPTREISALEYIYANWVHTDRQVIHSQRNSYRSLTASG